MPNAKANCFADTTLLVYAVDPGEPKKQQAAANLLRMVARAGMLVLSAQSLDEFYRATTDRRGLFGRAEARAEIASASRADCGVFFSEDLQHGRRVDHLPIVNPFRVRPDEAFKD